MKTVRHNVQYLSAEIESLRENLRHVRQESLEATRQGDFRKVARLTTQAANLNRAILEAQGLLAAAA